MLSAEEYFKKIRQYLKYIINNLKKSDTWKIQSTIAIKFISSKDNHGERVVHTESDSIEKMINYKVDEVTEEIFESLLNRYKIRLEKSVKGSDFIFDYIHLLDHIEMLLIR